jgi:hypothetical protein
MKDLFIGGHPDDAEVMFAYGIEASADPYVVVGSNGEGSTVDMCGGGFCPGWQTSLRIT